MMEVPAGAKPSDDDASGKLLVTCICSAKFRVKAELAGKKIKCPKCAQGLTVPGAPDQPTVTVSGRLSRPQLPETKSFADMAADLESQPPLVNEPVELKERLNKGKLKKLTTAIEKKNGEGKAEAELRRQAVLEVGKTADVRAAVMLIPLASDYWISVREGVAEALGMLRDPAGVPTLVRLLGDDVPDVKRDAVVSLGKIGDARAVRPLLDIALQEPLFRFTAGEAITCIGKSAVPILLQILNEEDPGRSLEAIIVLGRIKDPEATEPIAGMLSHRFAIIRGHAAESLGMIGDARSAPSLIRALSDHDAVVRAQAAAALQKVGDVRAVPALMKLLVDEDLDVCARAATTLGELGDRRAAAALVPLLERAEPEVRGAAADALGKLADEIAAEPLTRLFHDDTESVRLKAVSAFRQFRSASATAPLLLLLDDANVQIRQRAVDSLGEIGNAGSLDRLLVALRADSAVEVRMAAAKALGLLKSPKALKALEEALDDDLTVRCRAISALGDIGDASSLPALLAMLKDPTPEVRYHASQSLAEIGHQNSRKPLEDLLGDDNPMVRRGAAKALIKLGDPRGEKLLEEASARKKLSPGAKLSAMVPDWLVGIASPASAGGQLTLLGSAALVTVGLLVWFAGPAVGRFFKPAQRLAVRGKVNSVALSFDGKRMLTGRSRGTAEIWDVASGRRQEEIVLDSNNPVTGIAISPDGQTVYCTYAKNLERRTAGRRELLVTHTGGSFNRLLTLGDGKRALACSFDGGAYVVNLESGKLETSLILNSAGMTSFDMSPDGSLLAWGDNAGLVSVFDLAKSSVTTTFQLGKVSISSVAISGDNKLIAASNATVKIAVWDLATNKSMLSLAMETRGASPYSWMQFHPQQPLTILAVAGRSIEAISMESGSVENYGVARLGPTEFVAIDGKAQFLACGGSEEDPVWIVDLPAKKLASKLNR